MIQKTWNKSQQIKPGLFQVVEHKEGFIPGSSILLTGLCYIKLKNLTR